MYKVSYINSIYQYIRSARYIGELFFCDTKSDFIKRIDLKGNKEIEYKLFDETKSLVGPHNFRIYNDIIITANNYSDSISIIKYLGNQDIININVSREPKDISLLNNKVYVICNDINAVDIIDMDSSERIITVKVGSYPHSIDVDIEKKRVYIASFLSGSVEVLDCNSNTIMHSIRSFLYPIKVLLSKNNQYVYVLESNVESGEKGYITFINKENYNILCRICVGLLPLDCVEDDKYIYVSNYGDSTISVVSIEQKCEVLKIDVRGAPKAISKYCNSIFYSDYDSGNIYEVSLSNKIIKKIASGREPNAIIVI